jgi:hypothetical protein
VGVNLTFEHPPAGFDPVYSGWSQIDLFAISGNPDNFIDSQP